MGNLAIIGYHEVPTLIAPERTREDILFEVCMGAIRDAGIDKDDVEGWISVAPQAQPKLASEMLIGKPVEDLGLKGVKDSVVCNAGGASTTNCLRMAEQWIDSGMAKIVIVPHVTVQSDLASADLVHFFAYNGIDLEWEYPFGSTFNGAMALITRRYMYETGSTAEDMAAITVALRDWASRDPLSLFCGKPVTIEDVINSRMISSPLRAKECNKLADGGGALVLAHKDLAREICDKPVYKLGHGSAFPGPVPLTRQDTFWRKSYRSASDEALAQANLRKEDIDIFEIYGAYPFSQATFLEGMELCGENDGARFIRDGHTMLGGKLPCTTIGDATGRGHTGSGVSMAFYINVARQLMDRAGANQIHDVSHILNTTCGGTGFNQTVTIWGREAA